MKEKDVYSSYLMQEWQNGCKFTVSSVRILLYITHPSPHYRQPGLLVSQNENNCFVGLFKCQIIQRRDLSIKLLFPAYQRRKNNARTTLIMPALNRRYWILDIGYWQLLSPRKKTVKHNINMKLEKEVFCVSNTFKNI